MTTSKRILIIDDDPSVIGYLKRLLQTLGYTVETCDNGAEGLRQASSPSFDLVISDLNMPGDPSQMDLIRQLRDVNPDRPLVVVSGYPTQDRLDECREIGVTEFLTKPFEMSFIKNVLRQLFEEEGEGANASDEYPTVGEK